MSKGELVSSTIPIKITPTIKDTKSLTYNQTFNFKEYYEAFYTPDNVIYQIAELFPEDWTITPVLDDGLCLARAIFSKLKFTNKADQINFDTIYKKEFIDIIIDGLFEYFNNYILISQNGFLSNYFHMKPRFFTLQESQFLLEKSTSVVIELDNDRTHYLYHETEYEKNKEKNSNNKNCDIEELKRLLKLNPFKAPNEVHNLNIFIAYLLAISLKINILIIEDKMINIFYGMNGEYNVIIPGFTEIRENNSIILICLGNNNYKLLDNADRKNSVKKIYELVNISSLYSIKTDVGVFGRGTIVLIYSKKKWREVDPNEIKYINDQIFYNNEFYSKYRIKVVRKTNVSELQNNTIIYFRKKTNYYQCKLIINDGNYQIKYLDYSYPLNTTISKTDFCYITVSKKIMGEIKQPRNVEISIPILNNLTTNWNVNGTSLVDNLEIYETSITEFTSLTSYNYSLSDMSVGNITQFICIVEWLKVNCIKIAVGGKNYTKLVGKTQNFRHKNNQTRKISL
jgi:hypothetical protein